MKDSLVASIHQKLLNLSKARREDFQRTLDRFVLEPAHPASRIKAYPWETVIAEKLQAMIHFGLENSRMKDFFDLWFLSQNHTFSAAVLREALRMTFDRRETPWPAEVPAALTGRFSGNPQKQAQWKGFLRKSGLKIPNLKEAVSAIHDFLWPLMESGDIPADWRWSLGWRPSSPAIPNHPTP